jgi:type II secretory ATPase GspE/PulE/Tfp pilus assembly ATPase PilB-like protein
MRQKILNRESGESLDATAIAMGMIPLRASAIAAIRAGETSPAEVRRVMGPD